MKTRIKTLDIITTLVEMMMIRDKDWRVKILINFTLVQLKYLWYPMKK